MRKKILLFLFLLLIPVTGNAKTVHIKQNIYTETINKLPYNIRIVLQRLNRGEIGYIGYYDDTINVADQIIKYTNWNFQAMGEKETQKNYQTLLSVPSFSLTKTDISEIAKGESPNYCLAICPIKENTANARIAYWKYAKKAVRKAGVRNGMSDKTAVKKIYTWLCHEVKYQHGKKDNCEAATLFLKKTGVCRDYADAFWAMCQVCGIPCKCYIGYALENHEWNRVKIGKKWYWIDVTWMDDGRKKIDKNYGPSLKLWKDHRKDYEHKKNVIRYGY